MDHLADYLEEICSYKERLFGLYSAAGAVLAQKDASRAGGTTWGYRLASWEGYRAQKKITGSSIGEDEIRIFYDICRLVKPERSIVIGNGFGLSTFALALAWPSGQVVAMDNWSEGEAGLAAQKLSARICRDGGMEDRVRIFTGSSPQDIPAALQPWLDVGLRTVDLAFIDGLHTEEAAAADFAGLRPYLTGRSVVLWHNVHGTRRVFEQPGDAESSRAWEERQVLRTYGPLGVYYRKDEHPRLDQYLQTMNLLWNDWFLYITALSRAGKTEPPAPSGVRPVVSRRVRSLLERIRRL